MTTWIVQTNFIQEHHHEMLIDALTEQGTPVYGVKVIPFVDELELPKIDDPKIVPYGSTKLQRIGNINGWPGGVFFDDAMFRVNLWNKERDDMLNSDAVVMTVTEALPYLLSRQDETFFTRPVRDLKAYSGATLPGHEIYSWLNATLGQELWNFDKDTEIVLASPKHIEREWRYFVVGGKIVSGSSYRWKGTRLLMREQDRETLAEAQAFADKWLPHETVVMDLALTDEGMRVIEFNCLNASGFYYHDIKAIARAVTEYVDGLPL